jgi:hypothetical protein
VPRNLPDTDIKVLYCFYQNNDDSKCEVAHRSPSLIPHKNPPDLGAREHMAPKPFVFTAGMALTILAVMTWTVAALSACPIYQPQLLLLY